MQPAGCSVGRAYRLDITAICWLRQGSTGCCGLQCSSAELEVHPYLLQETVLEKLTGADIWPECEGSDHCPVWADLEFTKELPRGHVAPALSSSSVLKGGIQQGMLHMQPAVVAEPAQQRPAPAEPGSLRALHCSASLAAAKTRPLLSCPGCSHLSVTVQRGPAFVLSC